MNTEFDLGKQSTHLTFYNFRHRIPWLWCQHDRRNDLKTWIVWFQSWSYFLFEYIQFSLLCCSLFGHC
jgi:hypothetical protein